MQLNYHLYAGPPAHVAHVPPGHRSAHALFMSDSLRETLHRRQEAMLATVDAAGMPHTPLCTQAPLSLSLSLYTPLCLFVYSHVCAIQDVA
jgi:hypothetical protein